MIARLWDQVPVQILSFIMYIVSVIIYLIKLDGLNKLLLMKYPSNSPFKIIGHNNNQPLLYVIGAIIFYIVGILLIVYFSKSMSRVSIEGTIFLIISVILIIVSLILIFFFINNPILRAFLVVIGLSSIFMGAISQS